MTVVLVVVALVATAWLTLVLMEYLVHRPALVTWFVLTLVVVGEFISPNVISAEFGAFRVSVVDVGFALVTVAAILRLVRLEHFARGQMAIIVLIGMAFLSLLFGLAGESIGNTVNDFRGFLGFIAAVLYFSTVPRDLVIREAMTRAWLWAGLFIAGVVMLRWAGRITGTDLGVVDRFYDATIRVVNGPVSFFVASCALILLLPGLEGSSVRPRLERYTGVFLLLLSILLNRRAVWVTLGVALVALLLRRGQLGRRLAVIVITGAVLFAAAVPLFFSEDDTARSAAQSVNDTATLSWRVEGWVQLLESGPDEATEYVIGQPFGTGYNRVVRGNEQESNPHSFYLQTYLRSGLIGLGALLFAIFLGFLGLARAGSEDPGPLASHHLLILLAMQAVWFLTWPPGADQGIVLGLAVASSAVPYMNTMGVDRSQRARPLSALASEKNSTGPAMSVR